MLSFFILPPNSDVNSVAPSSEYSQNDIQTNPKRGTTIVYQPKSTDKLYSLPKDPQNVEPALMPMPYTQVAKKPEPIDDGTGGLKTIMSPEVKNKIAVVESTKNHIDIKLKETIERFPKGTLFHFKRI